jgi:hypothetical protein
MTARLAWGLVGLAIAAVVAGPVVEVATGAAVDDALANAVGIGIVLSLCFPVLGALVVRQHRAQAVGWLLSGIGVSIALHSLADVWSRTALVEQPGSLPFGDFAAWVTVWLWFPGWTLTTTLLPALFPDGRPTGRRRRLAFADAVAVAVPTIAFAAITWPHRGKVLIVEPEDVQGQDGSWMTALSAVYVVGAAIVLVLSVLSLGSLLARFRRADPDQRRQIAWVVYGTAVALVMGLVGAIPTTGNIFQVLQASALVGGIAVAMLRHRLYDIDIVVNRTLVYGALTATLAGAYAGSVLLLQLVLSPGSDLAVAVSTLAVAAMFRPARTRIQAAVDRRFYRRRYDAQRTLDAFTSRLRDQVELDALGTELRGVVTQTVQPAHVSLWLRSRNATRTAGP